jgi:hypothetical protein
MDEEIIGEMEVFLDATLLMEFATDQGITFDSRFETVVGGVRCTLILDGAELPAVGAHDEQAALDSATVQAIELWTRAEREREPTLAFA